MREICRHDTRLGPQPPHPAQRQLDSLGSMGGVSGNGDTQQQELGEVHRPETFMFVLQCMHFHDVTFF